MPLVITVAPFIVWLKVDPTIPSGLMWTKVEKVEKFQTSLTLEFCFISRGEKDTQGGGFHLCEIYIGFCDLCLL